MFLPQTHQEGIVFVCECVCVCGCVRESECVCLIEGILMVALCFIEAVYVVTQVCLDWATCE